MTKKPALIKHGHYLFEDGVLEFDTDVEIHSCRFGPNMTKITNEWVPNYPHYQVLFENPNSFKVFINSTESKLSPNRENIEAVIANHKQYDLMLVTDPEIIEHCDNAIMFPYGTTWLNKGHIDHPDGLGKFDEDYLKQFWDNKKFEVSYLCSSHFRQLDGYQLRKFLWLEREWISIPKKFLSSVRYPVPDLPPGPIGASMLLPEDDKKHLFYSQFSLAIENASVDNYFTEKLMDCFLTKTVPIYFGCPNIGDYFNLKGMVHLDGPELSAAVQKINALTPETYEKMLPYIEENYQKALEYCEKTFAERVKEQIDIAMFNKSKYQKLLTIGVLTLEEEERKAYLNRLLTFISQNTSVEDKSRIEIIVNSDDGTKSVGQKRNEVLDAASGEFVCFIDDDDLVDGSYVRTILDTIENNEDLDCIGFSGMYYVDGKEVMLFKHANEYGGHYKDAMGVQHRPVNHLNPVRTEYARQIRFPEKDFGEDSDYCDRLLESGLIKNEVIINKIMYHYLWSEEGSRTHV